MVAFVRDGEGVRERPSQRSQNWVNADPAVVLAARDGCRTSRAALMLAIRDRVRSIAWRVLEDDHAVEDAVQDTYLAVLEQLGELRDPVAFETWVIRIARNVAISAQRRQGRCRPSHHVHEDHSVLDGEIVTRWGSREPGPLAVVVVRAAVEDLSHTVRETMELRYSAGLSCEAIARRQGISLASVKTRLHRGRRAMRDAFRGLLR